ncbi:hypothetical protein FKW77_005112 [Venturia effusa]|uniref:Uncharacterized protein n=1 Tax=Venturia effusa TaxID=50376 RepID=A0A517LCB6_9PEZI|nr:hypothetical protein FKW77_005112 [Venturia effusa]
MPNIPIQPGNLVKNPTTFSPTMSALLAISEPLKIHDGFAIASATTLFLVNSLLLCIVIVSYMLKRRDKLFRSILDIVLLLSVLAWAAGLACLVTFIVRTDLRSNALVCGIASEFFLVVGGVFLWFGSFIAREGARDERE